MSPPPSVFHFGIERPACIVYRIANGRRQALARLHPFIAALAVIALGIPAAQAKSDKSKVVQRALRQSVRIEVLVRGKVERAASGVVIGSEGRTSYLLTNQHAFTREGLRCPAPFQVLVERTELHRSAE